MPTSAIVCWIVSLIVTFIVALKLVRRNYETYIALAKNRLDQIYLQRKHIEDLEDKIFQLEKKLGELQ